MRAAVVCSAAILSAIFCGVGVPVVGCVLPALNLTGKACATDADCFDTAGLVCVDHVCAVPVQPGEGEGDVGEGEGDVGEGEGEGEGDVGEGEGEGDVGEGEGEGDVGEGEGEGEPPPPDGDGDGVPDSVDACPGFAFEGAFDEDGDGVPDDCDNCPDQPNPGQENHGELDVGAVPDALGDLCDPQVQRSGDHILVFQPFNGTSVDRGFVVGNGSWTVANGKATPASPATAWLRFVGAGDLYGRGWVISAVVEFVGKGSENLGMGVAGLGSRDKLTTCALRVDPATTSANVNLYDSEQGGALAQCGGTAADPTYCVWQSGVPVADPTPGALVQLKFAAAGSDVRCRRENFPLPSGHSSSWPVVVVQNGIGVVRSVIVYELAL